MQYIVLSTFIEEVNSVSRIKLSGLIEVDIDGDAVQYRTVDLNPELQIWTQLRNYRRITTRTKPDIARFETCPITTELHSASNIQGEIRILSDKPGFIARNNGIRSSRLSWQIECPS